MRSSTSQRSVRILIYVFPALVDMLVAQVAFVNSVRLAKMHVSDLGVAAVAAIWSAAYMVSCLVVGRFVTTANAVRTMIAACASLVLLCWLFTIAHGVAAMYVLCAAVGVATACFFPPFQVFMKAVDRAGSKPPTYSAGLYTFAWSTGFAVGPFIAGFLMETGGLVDGDIETGGWKLVYAVAGGASLLTAVGIWLLGHLARPSGAPSDRATAAETTPAARTFDYSRMPDLAWLAWVGSGTGVAVLSIVRGVFPAHAVKIMHMADSVQGTVFFLLSITQALTGLVLCFSRRWMYRPLAVGTFGLVGISATLCFGSSSTASGVFYLASMLFGIYSGSFFFYLVFHAITHPVRSSHYVAINEAVVGVAGIVGPVVGGVLADRYGFGLSCSAGAMAILLVVVFQMIVHRRHQA